MSVFTYTATRNLAPGRTLSDLVKLELRLLTFPLTLSVKSKQNESISGVIESILYREEKGYSCSTELIEPFSQMAATIREFIASTYNGESFLFDRYGTIAQPDNPVSCYMVQTSFDEEEVGNAYYRYRLSFREA